MSTSKQTRRPSQVIFHTHFIDFWFVHFELFCLFLTGVIHTNLYILRCTCDWYIKLCIPYWIEILPLNFRLIFLFVEIEYTIWVGTVVCIARHEVSSGDD